MKTIFAALSILTWAAAVCAQAPARARLATQAPRGSSVHQALLGMGDKWRKAPGGGVSLTFFTDGTMGGEAEMVRRMRVGQIDGAVLTVVGLSEIDGAVKALQEMPMMFRSLDEVDYIRGKLAPDLERRFLEKGFVVLFWGDVGWVRFFSKEPALHPSDLKRMKIFVWGGDTNQLDLMKSAGYRPVPLEINDVLTGLQTGMIDVVPTAPFHALAGQIYGPAPHMLEVNWVPLVGAAVITRKTWDSFPPAVRAELRRAAVEAGEYIKLTGRAESDQSVEAMKKRRLTVHQTTPEIEAEWRKMAEEVYPKIRGHMVPAETFDEVRRLLTEYRAAGGKARP